MYGQWYEELNKVQEYDPTVYRVSREKKLQSIVNSIGEQSTLLFVSYINKQYFVVIAGVW